MWSAKRGVGPRAHRRISLSRSRRRGTMEEALPFSVGERSMRHSAHPIFCSSPCLYYGLEGHGCFA
jgi:hypothetical protein